MSDETLNIAFKKWADTYGLSLESNYSPETEFDCQQAFAAGHRHGDSERDALKARVAELEKDAARWKWMRANWFNFGVMSNINTPFGHAAHNIAMAGDEQTLDIAVDAAMAASKEAS